MGLRDVFPKDEKENVGSGWFTEKSFLLMGEKGAKMGLRVLVAEIMVEQWRKSSMVGEERRRKFYCLIFKFIYLFMA